MTKSVDTPKSVIINGVERKIPQGWFDLNIRQYKKLKSYVRHNDIIFMAAMLDVSEQEIIDCDITDLDHIVYANVSWYISQKDTIEESMSKMKHKSITVDGKVIDIPKDLKMETFGQKISAEQLLEKAADKNPYDIIAEIIAIYLYPKVYNKKFDYDAAIEFRDRHVYDISIIEAFPLGTFFLKRLGESLNEKLNTFLENIPEKRRRQILGS